MVDACACARGVVAVADVVVVVILLVVPLVVVCAARHYYPTEHPILSYPILPTLSYPDVA